MTTPSHPLHPRRYFDASPTWFRWNKLSIRDIHALRTEPSFQGQNVAFHLNHPIQYVYLVGLLAQLEATGPQGRYVLLSLDDGSGAGIAVKVKMRVLREGDAAEYPSNTEVDNVDVKMEMGLPVLWIDGKVVRLNTVLKVKGTLETFRGVRQIALKRVGVLETTSDEARAWAEVARYKREVLSRPWVLTEGQKVRVDEERRLEEAREMQEMKSRKVRDRGYQEKKRAYLERAERKRKEEEQRLDAGALRGSEVLRQPWD